MTKLLTTTFIAAAAAVAMGSSAFAGTYLNEMGTGDIHPIVNQHAYASAYEAPSYTGSTRHSGLRSYAMVGQQRWTDSNHPSMTGGGSIGYNANLSNY